MSSFTYTTEGVCSKRIIFTVENNTIKSVRYEGGCSGNLQAVSKLVEGLPVEEVVKKLRGIRCGANSTSCPDQLAKALEVLVVKRDIDSKAG